MLKTAEIPRDPTMNSNFAFAREGYLFIKNRVDHLHSDIFMTNLLAQNVICLSGKEAAEIFYDPELFLRHGAAPKHVQKTLFGENTIQSMDGQAHLDRKKAFLSLTSFENQNRLAELVGQQLLAAIDSWESMDEMVLFNEANIILCKAACEWAGIPMAEPEAPCRARDFAAMIDGFGGIGPRYWKGKIARGRTEDWMARLIKAVRSGRLCPNVKSPLSVMANLKGADGTPVDAMMSAKELMNLIRPIVAIGTYSTFIALALQEHPDWKKRLEGGDSKDADLFVREIRRFYPFTPFVGAKVRKDFLWKGYRLEKGTLTLLDIYGINHDARLWENPMTFLPERFENKTMDLFAFIPQGGGDSSRGHRCPGEGFVQALMNVFLRFLLEDIRYEVPVQDIGFEFNRIPTRPKSGFVMRGVLKKSSL